MDRVALGEARTILFTYNIAEPDHVTFRKMLLLAEQVTELSKSIDELSAVRLT